MDWKNNEQITLFEIRSLSICISEIANTLFPIRYEMKNQAKSLHKSITTTPQPESSNELMHKIILVCSEHGTPNVFYEL